MKQITEEELLNSEVRALSWKNPYGLLMLNGKIETRTWKTKYRGLVLICISKGGYNTEELIQIAGNKQYGRIMNFLASGLAYDNQHPKNVTVRGHAIALARLVDCRPMTEEDEDACYVKYKPGLYCHVYEDVAEIHPTFWSGNRGWKTLIHEEKEFFIFKNKK